MGKKKVLPVLTSHDVRFLAKLLRGIENWDDEEREDLIERLEGCLLVARLAFVAGQRA